MRIATMLAVAFTTGGLFAAESAQASITHYELNIPRQPLDTALKDLAQQTGLQVGRFSDAVKGDALVGPITGNYSADQALNSLLAPARLTYRTLNDHAVIVLRPEDIPHLAPANTLSRSGENADSSQTNDHKSFWSRLRLAQTTHGSVQSTPSVSSSSSNDGSGAEQAPLQKSDQLDEIVVTATRRPQSLQKVPAAVTALGAEALAEIGPTNIGAALNLVPGVSFTGENTYRTNLTIRGVSGSNEDAAVAVYLDGVYIGHDLGQNLSNLDPDSIQVLRGPQGALYGKNTLGGAVIVNSRQPSFDTHVSLLAGYGNDDRYNARASVTGALIEDRLAGYAFGYTTGHDGEYHNVFDGREVGSGHDFGGQAALLLVASDSANVTLRGDFSDNRYQDANRKGLRGANNLFAPNQLSVGYNDNVALDFIGPGETKNYGTVLKVEVNAELFTLTSVSAYRGFRVTDERDVDGTGLQFGYADIFQKQNQVSQEFTLTSRGDSRFNWIAGVQLFHEDLDEVFRITDRVGAIVFPRLGARVPVNYVYNTHNYTTDSFAPYAQADFKILSGLTLAGGVRYSYDKRKYFKTETQYLSNPDAVGFLYEYPERASYNAVTPEASLTYEFTPDMSLYGKYGKSYRPGGFNVNPTLNPNGQNNFNKETANSYEVGLRTRFLDNRVTLNTTAFRINWANQQVSFINQIGAFTVANVQSHSRGIELEATASITRALQVGLAGTYLDAEFGHVIFPTRDPITRAAFFADADGTPLNFAPKWSGSAYVTYTYQLGGDQSVLLRTDAAYKSQQNVQPLRPDLAGPAILRLNGRLQYDRGPYRAALWVKNALNRFSNYTSQSSAIVDVIGLTEPRTFGAEVGYKF